MPSPRTKRATRLFFVLLAVVYTCVFPYMAWVNNPNENARTYMTMALVEDHTFQADRIVERQGWTNDMATVPSRVPREPAHHYSVKAPAISYAGIPVYWAFTKIAPLFGHPVPTLASPAEERAFWLRASTFALRLFVVQIPAFLFLVFFERYLRNITQDPIYRLAAVAAVGLGSNYLAYSLMYVSHALCGAAAFTSFAITEMERARTSDSRERRTSRAFLAGYFAGLTTLFEYHAFPVSCLLGLYALSAFWRPKRLLALIGGGSIDVALLMFFQWRAFGSPFTPGHRMVDDPSLAQKHHHGLYGIAAPDWDAFHDLSLSHAFGFFGTSPFMWLGLLAIPFGLFIVRGTKHFRRQRRLSTLVWTFTMLVFFLTASAAAVWRGGWTIGPRLLGAAPAFFAYGAVTALEAIAPHGWRRTVARGVAVGLALASAITIGLVALVYNTLPESVTRPLVQIALPFLRAGFVPYHVGHLLGVEGPNVFFVVLGMGFAGPLLVILLWKASDTLRAYVVRMGVTVAVTLIGIQGALSAPSSDEGGDGAHDTRNMSQAWEPKGNDRIAQAREEADRVGPRGPCLWYQLADLERIVRWDREAAHDEKRATEPRSNCR
ncbi:hypothetical protein LVJ94_45995 [Pendulispora rubella]|uniref:Mannosyltransferase n=1 Tax=Pendulispora rubella TaxID=2741070 RepID=A0ABZ2L3V4_9BACT